MVPSRGTIGGDYFLSYTFISGFSGFAAGVAGVSLPVGLLDFTGRLRNNSAVLNWKTTFELNSKGFDIERSFDGLNFSRIGYVSAAGFSNTKLNYTFTDQMIAQENNYYRLKQIDIDNKFEYSRVILIKNPLDKNGFKVLRNPFSNSIDFQLGKIPKEKVQATLVDLKGVQVMNWSSIVSFQRVRIDVGALRLSRGIYVLNVQADGHKYVERLMKE